MLDFTIINISDLPAQNMVCIDTFYGTGVVAKASQALEIF